MTHTRSILILSILIFACSFLNTSIKASNKYKNGGQQDTLETKNVKIGTIVAITEIETSPDLTCTILAYPDKSNEMIILEVKGRMYQDMKMEFYNAVGKLVYDQPLVAGTTEIDVSSMFFGNYVIKVKNKSGNLLKSFKVVKEK